MIGLKHSCHFLNQSARIKTKTNCDLHILPFCLLQIQKGLLGVFESREVIIFQLLKSNISDHIFYSDNLADITHALQRLTEAPHVASLSTAVSRATSRISAMSERSSEEFPIPGNLLHEILKVYVNLIPVAVQ